VVIVSTWTVHVAVLDLFLGSSSHARELYIEVERLTSEWVVGIQRDVSFGQLNNASWYFVSLWGYELDHKTDFDVSWEISLRARKGNNHLLVSIAIAFSGLNGNLERGSCGLAYKRILESWNYL
jgi:hypothetical protein